MERKKAKNSKDTPLKKKPKKKKKVYTMFEKKKIPLISRKWCVLKKGNRIQTKFFVGPPNKVFFACD